MEPTATSNTNHPAVIDFNGKTYFIYHNGSLVWGSGFRRSVCVSEMTFNEDGTVPYIDETSTGLTGTCLLYTSDAADEEDSVDLGGRRIIKKKKKRTKKTFRKHKQRKDKKTKRRATKVFKKKEEK